MQTNHTSNVRFEKATESKTGHYIYAITDAAIDHVYKMRGIDASEVRFVSEGAVAAVVSDCTRQRLRPERAHLAAHTEVLKQLMAENTVLPMAFGTVADGEKELRRMLVRNQKDFVRELTRVRGKFEMGLRVVWDVPNIFEYFVDIHPDLRDARDRLIGKNREPRQEDKIELGQMFDQILNEERETQIVRIEEAMSPYCFEIKRSTPKNMNEVVSLNFLIGREKQKEFEDAVFIAANLFDNNYSFDINGPWAPYNFVEMNLKLNSR